MLYVATASRYIAVGIPLPDVGATYFEVVLARRAVRARSTASACRCSARRPSPPSPACSSARGRSPGACARWPTRRRRPRPSPAAGSTPGSSRATTPTSSVLAGSFNDMAAALQERVERDARFASDVSHELRSPLMTLAASVEVLQQPPRRDARPGRRGARPARGRRRPLPELVEDLLEISRFDAGAVRLNREDLLVAEFVRQAVSVSTLPDAHRGGRPEGRGPGHPGRQAPPGPRGRQPARQRPQLRRRRGDGDRRAEPARGRGDRGRADRRGGPRPRRARPTSGSSSSSASPAAARRGRRGSSEGAGLGLALVDEHVRLHGGRVWVEDRSDGEAGARFVIELPAEHA